MLESRLSFMSWTTISCPDLHHASKRKLDAAIRGCFDGFRFKMRLFVLTLQTCCTRYSPLHSLHLQKADALLRVRFRHQSMVLFTSWQTGQALFSVVMFISGYGFPMSTRRTFTYIIPLYGILCVSTGTKSRTGA